MRRRVLRRMRQRCGGGELRRYYNSMSIIKQNRCIHIEVNGTAKSAAAELRRRELRRVQQQRCGGEYCKVQRMRQRCGGGELRRHYNSMSIIKQNKCMHIEVKRLDCVHCA